MKRKVKDEDGYEEGHDVGDKNNNDVSQGQINSSNGIMNSRIKIEDDSKMTLMGRTTNGQLQLHLSKMVSDKDRGRIKCPYLDTVNRQMIDFDSEKLCSITLTNMNVYVCLVCGKYFQGRGKTTPLFTHSVQAGHFVFMNLQSGRVYCLPDDYEVVDTSLKDVQRCLSPRYSLEEISALNRNTSLARDVHGVSYLPGFVGLNNLNSTDYINSLLHALAHVTPFRDYWLEPVNYELCKSNIVHRFGLVRSIFDIHDDDDHNKRMMMMNCYFIIIIPFCKVLIIITIIIIIIIIIILFFYNISLSTITTTITTDSPQAVVVQQLQEHRVATGADPRGSGGVKQAFRHRPARRVHRVDGMDAQHTAEGCFG